MQFSLNQESPYFSCGESVNPLDEKKEIKKMTKNKFLEFVKINNWSATKQ